MVLNYILLAFFIYYAYIGFIFFGSVSHCIAMKLGTYPKTVNKSLVSYVSVTYLVAENGTFLDSVCKSKSKQGRVIAH